MSSPDPPIDERPDSTVDEDPTLAVERVTARSPRVLAAGGVAVLALVLLVAGGLAVAGIGPLAAGDAPSADGPESPVGSGSNDGSDGGDADGTNAPDHVRPFGVVVESIEECGTTCRDVTASLTNNGGNPRRNVTVTTRLFAGEDVVWEGRQSLGTFAPDETKTRTQRVEIGLLDAGKIERNDGYVTVVTTVRWDDGEATYRERRQVA